jgi:hypothetical protein
MEARRFLSRPPMHRGPQQGKSFRARFGGTAVLALIATAVGAAAIPASTTDRITAFRAKADAHVSAVARSANYGRARRLTVSSRPLTRAYVRFAVDGDGREMRRLNILLYSHTRAPLGYQVRLATRGWKERRITFENAPRPSSRFVSSGPLRARAWKAVDVTSLVGSVQEDVSFVLTTAGMRPITLSSRESWLHGPRLVIEYDARRL